MKNIHDDLSLLDLGIYEARDLAQNRPLWRLMCLHSATHSYSGGAAVVKAFNYGILYGRYAANIYIYYYQYSITPHFFIPGLKPSFSANPSHSLPFLLQD